MEGAFSQPNGAMCQHMLAWAQAATAGSQASDLLELYCGNANFTIPLAQNFRWLLHPSTFWVEWAPQPSFRMTLTADCEADSLVEATLSALRLQESHRHGGVKGVSGDSAS